MKNTPKIFPVLLGWMAVATGCATPGTGSSASIAHPVRGQPWSVPLAANTALPMSWIPPGNFTIGSPSSEPGRKADEGPPTQVTLTQGFWLGKTEVTIGEWKAVMGVGVRDQLIKVINDDMLYDFNGRQRTIRDFMNFSRDNPDQPLANQEENLPMYFVSWNDAMEFGRRLTAQEKAAGRLPEGYAYTLPTEAQWEYACRAGTTTPTFAGPANAEIMDKIAWYGNNSAAGYTGKGFGTGAALKGPRQAGVKQPNA
jgi:formylglycine-generating enzyme required for sulfatase activity